MINITGCLIEDVDSEGRSYLKAYNTAVWMV